MNSGKATAMRQAHGDGPILKCGTPVGFKVAFAIGTGHAADAGAALPKTPHETSLILVRRPNR
jgi:hypothetical protein